MHGFKGLLLLRHLLELNLTEDWMRKVTGPWLGTGVLPQLCVIFILFVILINNLQAYRVLACSALASWRSHLLKACKQKSQPGRPALGPAQSPIQWVPRFFCRRKQAGHDVGPTRPCSTKVKNDKSNTSTPPYDFMVWTGTTLPSKAQHIHCWICTCIDVCGLLLLLLLL
jgi:hypothetical protein